MKWVDRYGRESESYYNRNGRGIEELEVKLGDRGNPETDLINRERDVQKQWEDSRIANASYNKKYKEIGVVVVEGRSI